jgi:hypothetical protein
MTMGVTIPAMPPRASNITKMLKRDLRFCFSTGFCIVTCGRTVFKEGTLVAVEVFASDWTVMAVVLAFATDWTVMAVVLATGWTAMAGVVLATGWTALAGVLAFAADFPVLLGDLKTIEEPFLVDSDNCTSFNFIILNFILLNIFLLIIQVCTRRILCAHNTNVHNEISYRFMHRH